jgi:hypothetical protein
MSLDRCVKHPCSKVMCGSLPQCTNHNGAYSTATLADAQRMRASNKSAALSFPLRSQLSGSLRRAKPSARRASERGVAPKWVSHRRILRCTNCASRKVVPTRSLRGRNNCREARTRIGDAPGAEEFFVRGVKVRISASGVLPVTFASR